MVKKMGIDTASQLLLFWSSPLNFRAIQFMRWLSGQWIMAVKAVKEDGSALTIAGHVTPPAFIFVPPSNGSVLDKPKPYLESRKVRLVLNLKSPFPFSQTAGLLEIYIYIYIYIYAQINLLSSMYGGYWWIVFIINVL